MYEIAATLPSIAAIRRVLKIRMREAKSRIVVLKKKGIKASDLSDERGRVSRPIGVKRTPHTDIAAKTTTRNLGVP